MALQDFFKLAPMDVKKLKYKMATLMKVRFQSSNQDKPFSGGLPGALAYQSEDLKRHFQLRQEQRSTQLASPQKIAQDAPDDQVAQAAPIVHCTINIFQVAWQTLVTPNISYILNQCQRYVKNWDAQARGLCCVSWGSGGG